MSNHPKITIRQATLDDLPALCKLRNTKNLFEGYLEECDGISAYFLVAEVAENLAGFGLIYLSTTKTGKTKSHLPKLSDLYVGENYRRMGIATALIEARESIAKTYGHQQMYVSIDPTESAEMMNLVKKLGYQTLQDIPYAVTATFYDDNNRAFDKRYYRLDFIKSLNE